MSKTQVSEKFETFSTSLCPECMQRIPMRIYEEDGVIYDGCYVTAIIGIWAQDNKFGKRINANLLGVQFKKDGDPLASGVEKVNDDDFDDDDFDDEDDI